MIAASASAAEYTKEYEHAYEVGIQGFIYGEPLLNMQRLFQSNTSVTVPDAIGDAPVNQWSHFTELATTKEGEIVAPNADTLYSYAWLAAEAAADRRARARRRALQRRADHDAVEENIGNMVKTPPGCLPPGNYVIADRQEVRRRRRS